MKHVAIALIYRDHQLCVAERLSEPFKGYIECPGGKVEPNESIFAALRRELYEECGLAHFDAYYYTYTDVSNAHGEFRLHWFKVELHEEPQAIIYQKLMWIDIDQIDALHWIEHNRPYLHLFKRLADLEPKTVDIQSMDQLTEHLLDPQLLLGKVNTNEPELNELFSFYGFNDPF